jgi:hypothetical protein
MAKSPCLRLISVKAEPTFVSFDRRRHRSGKQLARWNGARPGRAAQRQLRLQDLRDQRQLRRRVGMGEAAAHRAPVAGLGMADERQGLAYQRHACGELIVALGDALPQAGACPDRVAVEAHVFQGLDLVDVDQPRRAKQAKRHHRHQALPAGNDLGGVAVLPQQLAGLLE